MRLILILVQDIKSRCCDESIPERVCYTETGLWWQRVSHLCRRRYSDNTPYTERKRGKAPPQWHLPPVHSIVRSCTVKRAYLREPLLYFFSASFLFYLNFFSSFAPYFFLSVYPLGTAPCSTPMTPSAVPG